MSFHLFSKNLYDEGLCIVRDIIEIGEAIASCASIEVMRASILPVINRLGLYSKLDELNEIGHCNVKDAYSNSENRKVQIAKEYLSIYLNIRSSLGDRKGDLIGARVFSCIKKMRLTPNSKYTLVLEYFSDNNQTVADVMYESMKDLM